MDARRSERQMAGWATLTRHFQLDEMEATHISMVTNGVYEGSVCVLCPDAMGDGGFFLGGGVGFQNGALVLHLLKELIGGVLIAVLLHLSEMALLRGHRCIHLDDSMVNGCILLLP